MAISLKYTPPPKKEDSESLGVTRNFSKHKTPQARVVIGS